MATTRPCKRLCKRAPLSHSNPRVARIPRPSYSDASHCGRGSAQSGIRLSEGVDQAKPVRNGKSYSADLGIPQLGFPLAPSAVSLASSRLAWRFVLPVTCPELLQKRPHNMIGRSQARPLLSMVAAGVAFTLGAAPAMPRPPQYRQAAPIPASEVKLAAFVFAGLVAFGVMLAWLWNRSNARQASSVDKIRRDNAS